MSARLRAHRLAFGPCLHALVFLISVGAHREASLFGEEVAPPQDLAIGRCWDAHGLRLDLGQSSFVYHVEVMLEAAVDAGEPDGAESSIALLDEHGRVAKTCHSLRASGHALQYACNGEGRWIAAFGAHQARLRNRCGVSVWGEGVAEARRMVSAVERLYGMASGSADGVSCTRCETPLAALQACARIARMRAAGADPTFSRWLAACTNDAGAIWLRRGQHERALQMFRRALPLIPDHPVVILNTIQLSRKLCDWSAWTRECTLVQLAAETHNRRGAALLNPYMAETYGLSAAQILDMVSIISLQTFERVHAVSDAPGLPALALPSLAPLQTYAGGRVRVGFYSLTGLNAGRLSIGRFLQSVLALHGVAGVAGGLEAVCYGEEANDDGSEIYRTLGRGCAGGRVLDTAALSFAEKASAIRQDALHLFVDLSGFTHAPSFTPFQLPRPGFPGGVQFESSVHRLMAVGMAPVHVSWWGYTGTLGAEYVHYVATDVGASPPEMRRYSSSGLFTLNRYQVKPKRGRDLI